MHARGHAGERRRKTALVLTTNARNVNTKATLFAGKSFAARVGESIAKDFDTSTHITQDLASYHATIARVSGERAIRPETVALKHATLERARAIETVLLDQLPR